MAEYTQEQKEQAARVLEKFQQGIYGYGGKVGVAIDTAISVLREHGWVRTSERLPTEKDADDDGNVLVSGEGGVEIIAYHRVISTNFFKHWMSLLALPEVSP